MCIICLRPIKVKERLILNNPASRHVIPVLEEFLSELYTVPTAAVLLADSSICRTCMRSIEKYQRLRKDSSNMESEIRPKMDKLGERYGLSRREKGVAVDRADQRTPEKRTPEKRTAEKAGFGTPCGVLKCKKYDIPIRKALQRMVPTGSSPAVAVSLFACHAACGITCTIIHFIPFTESGSCEGEREVSCTLHTKVIGFEKAGSWRCS